MIQNWRRQIRAYGAIAAMVPKQQLAYSLWVWSEFITQIIAMIIVIYFWQAVYAQTATLGGLDLRQTLNYILLAQVLAPLVQTRAIFDFGFLIRSGDLALELLRPFDFQMRYYVEALTALVVVFAQKLPLLLIAIVFFGLRLSPDPLGWLAFFVALALGQSVLFFFDWIFACLAFYTTETWGLSVVRVGVAVFFSGALLPVNMMPAWLQQITAALPFAQVLYVPAAFLTGLIPLAQAPQVWLTQLLWTAGLAVASRLIFNIAVRKITVQGG